MLSPTTRSNYARRHRLHALGLALASIVWHLWLSAYLSSVANGLAGDSASASDDGFAGRDGDDARDWEGAERRRIEGVRALLGIARVSSLVACTLHTRVLNHLARSFGPGARSGSRSEVSLASSPYVRSSLALVPDYGKETDPSIAH